MDQYCFARRRLSSVVVCNARERSAAAGRARGRSGGRQCTAGQYGYVPLRSSTPCLSLVYSCFYVLATLLLNYH